MLVPNWRELTAAYVKNQQAREQKLSGIQEAMSSLAAKPKLTDFIAFLAKLKEILEVR